MTAYRANRVVRLLTAAVSFGYFVICGCGVLLLIVVPAVEWFADDEALAKFTLATTAIVQLDDARLVSSWGPDPLTLSDTKTTVRVPISVAPGWFRSIAYAGLLASYVLLLLFVYHLRRLFQRVRDGAPFDARNAVRLRWLGLLLLALAFADGLFAFWQSAVVVRTLPVTPVAVRAPFSVDGWAVFVALVLIALAEIFRRGTELEEEQSLVV